MNRLMTTAAIVFCAGFSAPALAVGTLDGENIPSDFAAARLVGVQTNYTGAGDVTSLTTVPVFADGSELDVLYLAKDFSYLYVGLAGNLLEVGNSYVILIDSPNDDGQIELWTEGIGGPSFALQANGREVAIDDHGTPNDGADDTYTVVANSGTLLPSCDSGWDYALSIDTAGGTLYAHEYILYGIPVDFADPSELCNFADGRGRVPCDPTPDNTSDPALPIYGFRYPVVSSPLGDGNEINEDGDPIYGYQRAGFDNSNTAGVTDTDASGAATAITGVEIAIPLDRIGDAGLFGNETINLMVITMDLDEYGASPVSGPYGSVMNQALPALGGSSCDPPAGLGQRPDLSSHASCATVNLATLGTIDSGAVLEGVIDPSDYDAATTEVQQCPTSGGDAVQLADLNVPTQDGSELDAMYVDHDSQFLYVGLTGNLQSDGTSINVFVDVDGGAGDHLISDFSDFNLHGTYQVWGDPNYTTTFTSGATDFRVESTDFGGGWYNIDPAINAWGATTLVLDLTVNAANQADTARVVLTDTDGTERFYDFGLPGAGTYSLSLPLDAYSHEQQPGTVAGLDLAALSFFHIAGGFTNGYPGVAFDVTFDNLAIIDDDSGEHVLDFQPGAGGFMETVVEDFDNFSIGGVYGGWAADPNATFTSGPDAFRVQATAASPIPSLTNGGGWFPVTPNVDLSTGLLIEFDVTINAAGQSGTILLVLEDDDQTQVRWAWYDVATGSHTLTANLDGGSEVQAGSEPGFNAANVAYAHIQADYEVTDISFEDVSVVGVLPGISPIYRMNGNQLANGPLDELGNGVFPADTPVQYDVAYGINLGYAPHLAYVDYFDLVNDSYAFRGAVVPEGGSATLFDDPGGEIAFNPFGLEMGLNNENIFGVAGCEPNLPCFADPASAVATLAHSADTGVELAIPIADLGLSAGSLPRIIHLWTVVGGRDGAASNQSLPSMRNRSFEGNQIPNPGEAPVNFTTPESGPSAGGVVCDFNNFWPSGQWGSFDPNSSFTSDPNEFTIAATEQGGSWTALDPAVDAAGATHAVLDVTINAGNLADKVVIVLIDADGTTRLFNFVHSGPGRQLITVALSDYAAENDPGTSPGLDVSALTQFNVQGDWYPNNPLNMTFHNLELAGGLGNYEARAARICLGTVLGDGDCDGDNDLLDTALLQQCAGMVRDPVLPMECEQLDLAVDGVIDAQDSGGFVSLIDGP